MNSRAQYTEFKDFRRHRVWAVSFFPFLCRKSHYFLFKQTVLAYSKTLTSHSTLKIRLDSFILWTNLNISALKCSRSRLIRTNEVERKWIALIFIFVNKTAYIFTIHTVVVILTTHIYKDWPNEQKLSFFFLRWTQEHSFDIKQELYQIHQTEKLQGNS